jgi:hypothetical protein
MGFALSQEGDIVKLFVQNIWWFDIQSIFKDEEVTVKKFYVYLNADLEKNQGNYALHVDVKLRKQNLKVIDILPQLKKANPMKKWPWIDSDEIKKYFPEKVSNGWSAEELWAYHIEQNVLGTGIMYDLVEAVVENEDFKVQAEWELNAFCITFFNRKRLTDFLEKMPERLKIADFNQLVQSVKNQQSYASIKLRPNFKLAGNVNRMIYFVRSLKKRY